MERFRILIIGNANAGKTTILEKVCHANGREPKFLNAEGKKIDSEVKSSAERGEHDIETQIVYPTAHGFIFHDSRGFEAGTSGELEKVKAFISDRSKKEDMKDQLHAIWYCLPTSNDRPLTKAEMSLFETGTGNVPAIAIFTKMDALDKKVFSEQLNKGIPLQQAKQQVQSLAEVKFERDYLEPLKQVPHPPRGIVQLRNMHKSTTKCNQLLTTTAKALDGKTLKLLLLSTQRNNVEFCIEQVVKEVIIPHAQMALEQQSFSREQQKSLLHAVMSYFPHSLPSFQKIIDDMDSNALSATKEIMGRFIEFRFEDDFDLEDREDSLDFRLSSKERFRAKDESHVDTCLEALLPSIPSLVSASHLHCQVLELGTAITTVMVYSLFRPSPLLALSTLLFKDFQLALDRYMKSSSLAVMATVEGNFAECHSVVAADASKVHDMIMATALIADTIHNY